MSLQYVLLSGAYSLVDSIRKVHRDNVLRVPAYLSQYVPITLLLGGEMIPFYMQNMTPHSFNWTPVLFFGICGRTAPTQGYDSQIPRQKDTNQVPKQKSWATFSLESQVG